MADSKYKSELLGYASKLDAVVNGVGEITDLARKIVYEQDDEASQKLLAIISREVNHNDYPKEVVQIASVVKDSLIKYYGYTKISELLKYEELDVSEEKSISELLTELYNLIGLKSVKNKVSDLIDYQTVQQLRKDVGLRTTKGTLHLAFVGKPGTGKTTVARIVGRIYKQLGLLSKGHFIEVSRTDLIAGYQGQTALKVKKVIERAKGGVLFIDEAYSITENEHSDSYGRECLTELTKALEDYRDDLVVIVAGYTEPMKNFFESNPGLKSRFNNFIEFDDYDANELIAILISMCELDDYTLSVDARAKILAWIEAIISDDLENFSNGRFARNIYDDIVMNHARRVVKIENPTQEDLSVIVADDFINATLQKSDEEVVIYSQ